MTQVFNIYADESCHLEHDQQTAMVLGAIWCPADKTHGFSRQLANIKERHNLNRRFEIKWTKVSPAKLAFYTELIDYFFFEDDLHFRAVVIPEKSALNHAKFEQTHDGWYYKMYYQLLKMIIQPNASYRIYLDIKDTRSQQKIEFLGRVLSNSYRDFSRRMIGPLQTVRSEEVGVLQLADLLIGAISHANRGTGSSRAKQLLIEQITKLSKQDLTSTSSLYNRKVNIFRWKPRED